MKRFVTVWGFASIESEVGVLGVYNTRAEAMAEVARFHDLHGDNQAAAAWIRVEKETD